MLNNITKSGYFRTFRILTSMATLTTEIYYYEEGSVVYAEDERRCYRYDGVNWIPYDLFGGGIDLSQILVFDNGGAVEVYPLTAIGLQNAVDNVGKTIWLPDCEITGDIVMAEETVLIAQGSKSILLGTLTGNTNSIVDGLTITKSVYEGSNEVAALYNGRSGLMKAYRCEITCSNTGSGASYGAWALYGGNIELHECILKSTGSLSYAACSEQGAIYIYGGQAHGGTDRFLVKE